MSVSEKILQFFFKVFMFFELWSWYHLSLHDSLVETLIDVSIIRAMENQEQ